MFDIVVFTLTLWKLWCSFILGGGNVVDVFLRDGKYFST